MGTELSAHRKTGTALGATRSAGRGADVTTVNFATKALRFTDIPTTFPTGNALVPAGQTPTPEPHTPGETELAHITRQAPKPFRLKNGDTVQRRTGQAIYPNRIVTAVAERTLTQQPNGTYTPAGGWHLVRRTTHQLPGKAKRTTGTVPADTHTTPTTAGQKTAGETDPETKAFPDGSDAIAYLPAQVRRHIYALIPTPTHFDGKVVQYDGDRHYEVVVIRTDARTSIVATATRPENGPTWNVEMLTYDLATATTHTEGRQ